MTKTKNTPHDTPRTMKVPQNAAQSTPLNGLRRKLRKVARSRNGREGRPTLLPTRGARSHDASEGWPTPPHPDPAGRPIEWEATEKGLHQQIHQMLLREKGPLNHQTLPKEEGSRRGGSPGPSEGSEVILGGRRQRKMLKFLPQKYPPDCQGPTIFKTNVPPWTSSPPMFTMEAPAWTSVSPIVKATPMPKGTTEPPRGTEQGDGGAERYAAMSATPRESVGEEVEIPAKISNPDKRMRSGRVSMETTGNKTPMAR